MKRLYLMRHGHSPSATEARVAKDALRPLSERGRADARRMAEELGRRGGRPSLVLHSPLLRAVQTAAAAAEALGVAPESFKALDNTRPAEEVLEELESRAGAAAELLAVGHQPQVGEIAAHVGKAVFEIRPAGMVALELSPKPRVLWALNVDELD